MRWEFCVVRSRESCAMKLYTHHTSTTTPKPPARCLHRTCGLYDENMSEKWLRIRSIWTTNARTLSDKTTRRVFWLIMHCSRGACLKEFLSLKRGKINYIFSPRSLVYNFVRHVYYILSIYSIYCQCIKGCGWCEVNAFGFVYIMNGLLVPYAVIIPRCHYCRRGCLYGKKHVRSDKGLTKMNFFNSRKRLWQYTWLICAFD